MGAFEDEKVYGIKIRESANDGSDFPNPDVDYRLAFLGENGLWHVKDSAGAVTSPYAAAIAPFVGCKVFNAATQSINNNTVTALTFDSEDYDSDAFHSTVTNTSRLTVPAGKAGKYIAIGGSRFATNVTGDRALCVAINGTRTRSSNNDAGRTGVDTDMVTAAQVVLAVGDYVELTAYQTSGGALNMGHASATEVQSWLSLVLVGV